MNVDWGLRAGPPTPWALDTPSATVSGCITTSKFVGSSVGGVRRGVQRLVSGGGNSAAAVLVRGNLSCWMSHICAFNLGSTLVPTEMGDAPPLILRIRAKELI